MILLFDLNGTLFDDKALASKLTMEIIAEYGHTVTEDEIHGIMHYGGYLEEKFGIDREEFYPRKVKKLAEASTKDLIPDGAEDCVREADRRGYQRAVVTSFRELGYKAYNQHFDEDVRFDISVTTDDRAGYKPDTGPLLLALERLNAVDADLNQVWMIGDTDADVYAAANLGCHSALFRPLGVIDDKLESDATIVFTHFAELLPKIDQFMAQTQE